MGVPKHGKLSARSKNCAKYKAENRLEKNRIKRAKKHKKKLEKMADRQAQKTNTIIN